MNLYLDDDSAGRRLAAILSNDGHGVVLPVDASLSGAPDAQHFRHTIAGSLVLITRNHDDFIDLHEVVRAARGTHPGILVIRFDNDPKRDMSDRQVARAITKLQSTGLPLINEVYILNHWR